MEQNKIVEGFNEGGMTNSNGNIVVKLAVGALGVAAGIGTVLFLKKKKNQKEVESETNNVDDNE
jgi:hypothetical protein